MATILTQKPKNINIIVIAWGILALAGIITAALVSDYPPWGRTWEFLCTIWVAVGSVVGFVCGLIVRRSKLEEAKPMPGLYSLLSMSGLTLLWALIVSGFLSNFPAGQNAFFIPTSTDLYLGLAVIATVVAWFWWLSAGSEIVPGLMLLMLSGTAGGVLFNLHGAGTDYLFLIMAALWAGSAWCRYGQPAFSHPLVGGGFLLLLIGILAAAFGAYPGNSYRLLMRMSTGWIVAMGILAVRTEKEKQIYPALLASGVLLAILTIVRYYILISTTGIGYSLSTRLWLAGANPNALASALLLTTTILFMTKPKPVWWGRIIWGLLLTLIILMAFISLSKAVWLGILLLCLLGFLLGHKNKKRNLIIVGSLVLVSILAGIFIPAVYDRVLSEFSFSSRIVIWQAVLGSIGHSPWLGVGPGNSFVHAAFVGNIPYEQIFPMREYMSGHSHNIWLEITDGIGIIGLVLFLWMVIILIRRAEKDRIWLVAGMLGLLLTLSLSIGLSVNQFLPLELWVFLGLIASPNVRARRWHFALAGLLMIFAITGATSEVLRRQADQWFWKGENGRAEWRLNLAAKFNPWNATIAERQARLALAQADDKALLCAYERCVELAPGQPVWRARRGMLRLLIGDTEGARQDLERAVASDDFGILTGDLHAPLAAVDAACGDNKSAIKELHDITTRDPLFSQGPWSALIPTNDGWNIYLCPDFAPSGDKLEQRRRIMFWLGSDGASKSAIRKVYPSGTAAISYTDVIQEEVTDHLVLAPEKDRLAPFTTYEIGLSYYQARRSQGLEGSDLASLFGGFEKIPPSLVSQLDSSSVITKEAEIFKINLCLGLARAAQLAQKPQIQEAYTVEALRIAATSPGDIIAVIKNAGQGDQVVYPESVELDLANAKMDMNKGDIKTAAKDLEGYLRMALLTHEGWESWEDAGRLLMHMKDDSGVILEDVIRQFPKESLPVLIQAYLTRMAGGKDDAKILYRKAQEFANGNRIVVKACCEGYFALDDPVSGMEMATYYLENWPDDLVTLTSLVKVISVAGLSDQRNQWLGDLKKKFPFSADVELLIADFAEETKNNQAIEKALEEAQALNPVSASLKVRLARFYAENGSNFKAEALYSAALANNSGDISAWIGLGDLLVQRNDNDQAVAAVRYAQMIAPDQSWTNVSLGAMLARVGRKQEALDVLARFLIQQPDQWEALRWHAKIAVELGRKDLISADYARLLASGQADMAVYIQLAEEKIAQGKMEEALDLLIRGVQARPDDSWGWMTLGYQLSQADFFEQQAEWLSYLFQKYPNSAEVNFLKDQQEVLSHDPTAYRKEVEQAQTTFPQSAAIKAAWAGILLREGKQIDARKAYEGALQLDSTDMSSLIGMANLAMQKGDNAGAMEWAGKAQQEMPQSAWAAVTMAQVLEAGSRPDEALAVLGKYLSANPDSRYVRSWRARMEEKAGYRDKALVDYELLVSLKKGDITAFIRVAEAKMAQDKKNEAVALMETASKLYPQDAWTWATYGEMLRLSGDWLKARTALNEAIRLDPANPNYPKILASINH